MAKGIADSGFRVREVWEMVMGRAKRLEEVRKVLKVVWSSFDATLASQTCCR